MDMQERKSLLIKNFESDIFNIKSTLKAKTQKAILSLNSGNKNTKYNSNIINNNTNISNNNSNCQSPAFQKLRKQSNNIKEEDLGSKIKRSHKSKIEFNINSNRNKETYKFPIEQKIKQLNKAETFSPKYKEITPLERKNQEFNSANDIFIKRVKTRLNNTKSIIKVNNSIDYKTDGKGLNIQEKKDIKSGNNKSFSHNKSFCFSVNNNPISFKNNNESITNENAINKAQLKNSKGLFLKEQSIMNKHKIDFNNKDITAFQRKIAQEYCDTDIVSCSFDKYKNKTRNQEEIMCLSQKGHLPMTDNYNSNDNKHVSNIFFNKIKNKETKKDIDTDNDNKHNHNRVNTLVKLRDNSSVKNVISKFRRSNTHNNSLLSNNLNSKTNKKTDNYTNTNTNTNTNHSRNKSIDATIQSNWSSKLDWKSNNTELIFKTSKTITNKKIFYKKNTENDNFPLKTSTTLAEDINNNNILKDNHNNERKFPKHNNFLNLSYDCNQVFSKNIDEDFVYNGNKEEINKAIKDKYGHNTSLYRKNINMSSSHNGVGIYKINSKL